MDLTKRIEKAFRSRCLKSLMQFDGHTMSDLLGITGKSIISGNFNDLFMKMMVFSKRFNLVIHATVDGKYFIVDESGKLVLFNAVLFWYPDENDDV